MKQFLARKRSVVIGLFVLLAATGAAVAYWTTTGSGTGSASTGTTTPVKVDQVSSPSNLFPGSPERPLDVRIINDGDKPQYVTSITAEVVGTSEPECGAENYQIGGSPLTFNENVGTGGSDVKTGLTIKMLETNVNQDACKNVTVHIAYAAN